MSSPFNGEKLGTGPGYSSSYGKARPGTQFLTPNVSCPSQWIHLSITKECLGYHDSLNKEGKGKDVITEKKC